MLYNQEYMYSFGYKADGVYKYTEREDNEDFCVSVKNENGIISAVVTPKRSIEFEEFEITIPREFADGCRIFTNGYQSWTVSKEYYQGGSMDEFNPKILGIEKVKFNPLGIWGAGDLKWHKYPELDCTFYGYSYGYERNGNNITLFGSLSERVGYTIITFNPLLSTVTISKDLQGKVFDTELKVLELAVINDEYDKAFDKYFEMMNVKPPRVGRKCGYTTWYNYYTGVTEDIVNNDLAAISKLEQKIDIFQIDDGFERTVGDWLEVDKKKFPSGMKATADKIHDNNMLAGLWLAPFAATPKSYIYKNHKDWFVRNDKGKIPYCSHNWGGFFALDIYNEEVRKHLAHVFDVVLNHWGYDMVKLDFLYACCQYPIHNKTRGEIMCDAIDLLREWCGDKIILGCGCPLAPAFGKVDFMRIGADVSLDWNHKAYSREDVSTQNTLTNTIYRRHLDGRAWLNDPDVFLLRDNNIKLNTRQKEIIAKVNSLLGNLLFVSDDVSTYNKEQMKVFTDTISSEKSKIISAEINDDIATIVTEKGSFSFNIKTGV
ncbi:MAG: alpha-galactosidase [Eubacterium sp.]|nr:alpha-galactosidase [Eubacterium sp.]